MLLFYKCSLCCTIWNNVIYALKASLFSGESGLEFRGIRSLLVNKTRWPFLSVFRVCLGASLQVRQGLSLGAYQHKLQRPLQIFWHFYTSSESGSSLKRCSETFSVKGCKENVFIFHLNFFFFFNSLPSDYRYHQVRHCLCGKTRICSRSSTSPSFQ